MISIGTTEIVRHCERTELGREIDLIAYLFDVESFAITSVDLIVALHYLFG